MLIYQDLLERTAHLILLIALCGLKLLSGTAQRFLPSGVVLEQRFDLVWNNMLLLPGHLEFAETLANLPFFYKEAASKICEVMHVVQKNPYHLPEMVDANTLQEYLLGGEADQFVEYVDGYADESTEESDGLLDSWELGDEWLGSI